MIVGIFITWDANNKNVNAHFKALKEHDTDRGHELFLWKGALSCHDMFHHCDVFYFNQNYLVEFVKNNRAEYDRLKAIYDSCLAISKKYEVPVAFGWQCVDSLKRIICKSNLAIEMFCVDKVKSI